MVPESEKPKRLSLRPMARLFLVAAAIGILFVNGGGWRIAGFVVGGVADRWCGPRPCTRPPGGARA